MPESRNRRRRGRRVGPGSRNSGDLAIARPRARKTNYWYLAASVVIAVLVIAGFAVGSINFGGTESLSQTGDRTEYEDGLGVFQPTVGNAHVPLGQPVVYTSFPPTSGDHWPPGEEAPCGFYEQGLPDERVVHNLEHGTIVISYNLTDNDAIEELKETFDDIGLAQLWGVARYYDKLPSGQVAVAAWQVLDTMDGIDGDRIERFFEAYAGNLGPEKIPCRGGSMQ